MREWIDAHVHVLGGGADALRELSERERRFGYSHSSFLSVEGMDDAAQNALAFGYKRLDPKHHYAFGGLHYRFAYDFADEMLRLCGLGMDGMKMIENKPTERRRLGFAQNDPRYEKLYGTAEEAGIPFLIHVGDPRDFWDPERIPAWASAAGYGYFDPAYPSFDGLISETEQVLKKHPKLKLCLAHFFFLSDEGERLRRLMDAYPNLYLDVTAGTEMYPNFAARPEYWSAFFSDYQDRILYGTDNSSPCRGEDIRIAEILNGLERSFFGTKDRIPLWEQTLTGLGLPDPVVRKITVTNFRRFAGEEPRPLRLPEARDYLRERLSLPSFALRAEEKETISDILTLLT